MKKSIVSLSVAASLLVGSASFASAAEKQTPYLNEILELQPDLTSEELLSSLETYSQNTGISTEKLLKDVYKELQKDKKQAKEEAETVGVLGDTGGTKIIGSSSKSHIYYTPSQTAYLDHGHVGLYYTASTIVESVPSTGVRTISASVRKVDSTGAVIKSVKNATAAQKDAAANWAYSQVGDSYSYNFATNRTTSHYEAKNCSKLVWSAFLLKAGLDLDKDKGLGVYPRDVRDAPDTTLVRNI
ncbi:YiiX/YebB-like N1pC/P60 family cysteine hydrolase [Bacillus sp. CGMCC 1.16541]|uniref:YiiX/YebB-like N1pC/P60 family cysteine hydrolase n=1 Tax=Bacillus sp. CGMCC 1.16541 TaxID=2185143 RepID=UPI000D739C29|nr:YiiX/YebB-like N1pC/P60 family cysteine hydrolase [Bacillus sp. CGMCC 1.16541]